MSPDSLSLAGKVAIVTGSGRENGIGAAIALNLARSGARVTINYVSEASAPRAEKVKAMIEKDVGQGEARLLVKGLVAKTRGRPLPRTSHVPASAPPNWEMKTAVE